VMVLRDIIDRIGQLPVFQESLKRTVGV